MVPFLELHYIRFFFLPEGILLCIQCYVGLQFSLICWMLFLWVIGEGAALANPDVFSTHHHPFSFPKLSAENDLPSSFLSSAKKKIRKEGSWHCKMSSGTYYQKIMQYVPVSQFAFAMKERSE